MDTLLIQNFDQFLDALNNCELGIFDYDEVLQSAEINVDELAEYAEWHTESYCKKEIYRRGDYYVEVGCWENGQSSEIYSPPAGKDERILVVDGKLAFETFGDVSGSEAIDQEILEVKGAKTVNEGQFIRVSNPATERAISIHLIAK